MNNDPVDILLVEDNQEDLDLNIEVLREEKVYN